MKQMVLIEMSDSSFIISARRCVKTSQNKSKHHKEVAQIELLLKIVSLAHW